MHFSCPLPTQNSVTNSSSSLCSSSSSLPSSSPSINLTSQTKFSKPMGTEAIVPVEKKLRIFFFPFITSGHFQPMLNMASLFSSSHPSLISSTIITTPSNAHLVVGSHLSLHILPLSPTSLPLGWDSTSRSSTTSPDLQTLLSSLSLLRHPLHRLLDSDRPHCLVSDMFLPWTADVAAELGIPRIVFHGTSSFWLSVIDQVKRHRPHDSVVGDLDPFVVPGMPRAVTLTRSQLPGPVRARTHFNSVVNRMDESNSKSYGVIVNSFLELEGEFAEHYRDSLSGRAWHVGPVSLSHRIEDRDRSHCLNWLDSKERDAVIYVCFGSQANFSTSQLNELASGLLDSNHYFIWIVRKESPQILLDSELSESKKGIVIRGWAPQLHILNHESIGGFLTHCGWNSVMEGVSTGKPMVTWPVFGDQAINEKLIVDELKIGVRVGARIKDESEKEPSLIKSGDIARAIKKVMGKGEEEVIRMRRKAKKLGEEARGAVKEGGSSWREMQRLVEDLMSLNKDLVT